MILKEMYKRLFSLFLLAFFMISTSGIVFFYHFCTHSHETTYSFFIDTTDETCAENNKLHDEDITHSKCCEFEVEHQIRIKNNCCAQHKSYSKTVKLDSVYTFTKKTDSPKPIVIGLLYAICPTIVFLQDQEQASANFRCNIPPESPISIRSGRDIITHYESFKLDC